MVLGRITVSDDVFVDVADAALQRVEEVFRKQKKGAFADLGRLFSGRFASKVGVQKSDDEDGIGGTVTFDLKLSVVYGVNIPEMAAKVREAICRDIQSITGYVVERIDITVEKLVQPELKEPEREE
jgi:uncharacterized alkaline shock family protein YloU